MMLKLGWFLRVPSMIYFEWKYESSLNNLTRPEVYFLQMMQSMFIVPEAGKDVFPAINIVLQNLLSIIAISAFVSVSIFNLKVVKKLYIFLFCILLFVIGCNQYKLILIKLNPNAQEFTTFNNKSHLSNYWNIYAIDFVQFIPTSQFKSASLIFILPIIYCPWLIFVQYFDIMSTQLLALCYGIANLPGLCLALNLPTEAQIFTYNFAVTSFLIAIIYKIVIVCIKLPKTLSDLLADLFVLINFNHHEAALVEVPSVLWSLFSLSRQFIVFWIGLFITQTVILYHHYDHSLPLLMLGGISESVQSPFGFIGFSVVSCYLSRMVLRTVDWFVESNQFSELYQTHGIAEGFSTLLMMLTLNRNLLRITNMTNPQQINPKVYQAYGKNSTSPIGLIALVILIILSSITDSASELISSKLIHLTATAVSIQKWRRHITPLVSAFILFMMPMLICYQLYKHFIMDFWLMTIMGSFLMTSVHLSKSFISYLIYMNNARFISTGKSWVSLPVNYDSDDIILVLNGLVQSLEICIAISLIILLIKRTISGHFNLVSIILLIVHFYFNVFERIKVGWAQYKHRKIVLQQIEKLNTINVNEESDKSKDVCAICFNDLCEVIDNGVVKETICGHYFHRLCLKKWLLIKYSCPMCSSNFKEAVYYPDHQAADHQNATRYFAAYEQRNLRQHNEYDDDDDDDIEPLDTDQEQISSSPHSSSDSIVYDDEDIDLKVYQDIDSEGDWRGNPDDYIYKKCYRNRYSSGSITSDSNGSTDDVKLNRASNYNPQDTNASSNQNNNDNTSDDTTCPSTTSLEPTSHVNNDKPDNASPTMQILHRRTNSNTNESNS